ncbi:MAG: hypothetical protein ABEI54_04345 [Candidatus Bipolaricaulia bacterium]
MLFDINSLRDRAQEILGEKTEDEFLIQATANLRQWLEANPRKWVLFGPYWPCIWRLMRRYQSDFAQPSEWDKGQPPPDYLSQYRFRYPILEWVAAMEYLNRHGEYIDQNGGVETILLPDRDRALYQPGVGLLDTRGERDNYA